MTALASWEPDVVCLQEMAARRDIQRLRRHLWSTANTLGMIPILGSEGGVSGNHPAILVSPAKLTVIDDGPPPRSIGHDPSWCEALLQVRSAGQIIRVYSIHLPPRSAAIQLGHAQKLATSVAQRGELAVICGDFNCYAPGELTAQTLTALPLHLRPARMRILPGGDLAANYDVHEALASVGLVDVAAALEPDCREPRDLTPSGINGGGRVDRAYVTSELWQSRAVQSYAQRDGGGSDHHLFAITLGLTELAAATASGFRP